MIPVHMRNFEKRSGKTDEEFRQWIIDTDHEIIQSALLSINGANFYLTHQQITKKIKIFSNLNRLYIYKTIIH